MTKEEKQLLLKDLCARLPYGVKVKSKNGEVAILVNPPTAIQDDCWNFKPYLRPMSSMTEDERDEFRTLGGVMSHNVQNDTWAISSFTPEAYDWLNEHHFDYRGLIPMGLALEAPEDMYTQK